MKNPRLNFRYISLVLIIVSFIVYLVFFDKNNYANRKEIMAEIDKQKKQIEYYQQNITVDSTLLENLKDDEFLERYAREHFLMKRENETVIVIE